MRTHMTKLVPRQVKLQHKDLGPGWIHQTLPAPSLHDSPVRCSSLPTRHARRTCARADVGTHQHAPACTSTHQHAPARTSTHQHAPARTSTDQHGPARTSTHQHAPARSITQHHAQEQQHDLQWKRMASAIPSRNSCKATQQVLSCKTAHALRQKQFEKKCRRKINIRIPHGRLGPTRPNASQAAAATAWRCCRSHRDRKKSRSPCEGHRTAMLTAI